MCGLALHGGEEGGSGTAGAPAAGPIRARPADLEDVPVHGFGDTVVFACLVRFPYKDEQGKLRNRSYRDVNVWMKVNGEWKQIAATATTILAPITSRVQL